MVIRAAGGSAVHALVTLQRMNSPNMANTQEFTPKIRRQTPFKTFSSPLMGARLTFETVAELAVAVKGRWGECVQDRRERLVHYLSSARCNLFSNEYGDVRVSEYQLQDILNLTFLTNFRLFSGCQGLCRTLEDVEYNQKCCDIALVQLASNRMALPDPVETIIEWTSELQAHLSVLRGRQNKILSYQFSSFDVFLDYLYEVGKKRIADNFTSLKGDIMA